MSIFRYMYVIAALFLMASTAATCFAPPRGQISADGFLPLLLMWSWLSSVAAAGVTFVVLGRQVTRAGIVLLITILIGVASATFDYWIVGLIIGRDISSLPKGSEIAHDVLYAFTAISCLAAPAAFIFTLLDLRKPAR